MESRRRALLAGTAVLALIVPAVPAASSGAAARASAPPVSATAAADSIGTLVFLRDHDVWIARADGSGARALTTDGTQAFPYGSPTQSDGGVVVATHADELVRMDQQGRVLSRIDPGELPTSNGEGANDGPLSAAISPDGRRIVYTMFEFSTFPDPGFRYATAYTAADRLTPPAATGTTFHWAPSWVGSTRTLQHGGFGSHVNLHDVGANDDQPWFTWSEDLGDTTLSRDGGWLAGITGFGASESLAVFRVDGDATSGPPPTQVPEGVCSTDAVEGTASPTFGPGHQLFWERDGEVWTHPDVAACVAHPERRLVADATAPHWAPAPLSPARPPQQPALRSTVRPRITGTPVVGRTLRADLGRWTPSATSYAVRWLRAGRPVAGATRTTYRPTRADRGKALTVRVTARRPGHRPATATSRPVRVRR